MWRLILFIYIVFLLNNFGLVDNTGITIPLVRQKTPKESAMNTKNMEKHGVYLNWLRKPHKHHHKNHTGNDSIALLRYLDNEFYGKVSIGQKGQVFNMVFDTTWQTSWVMSEDCSWKTLGCSFHNKYDHTISSTYVANGKKYRADEGAYNLTGYYSNDTFSIAHSRVNGQLFVEMVEVPYTFMFSKADGVMGLGVMTGKNEPFFYNLLKNKTIKKPLFSVYLSRDRQSLRGGNIILGAIEPKHIHHIPGPENTTIPEKIVYLPINPSLGYWQFRMDRVVLDLSSKNKSIPFCLHGCDAIPDTSANTIIGPEAAIKSIHEHIKAKYFSFGRYRVKCDTVNKLPRIDFVLAGKIFTLKGTNYVQKMSMGSVTVCVSAFVSASLPTEQKFWILGGAFLSQYYSIYDIKENKIGFVRAA